MTNPRLYVGTYTGLDHPVAGTSTGIYILQFDPADGSLQHAAPPGTMRNPSFVTLSPDGCTLYAVSEVDDHDDHGSGAVAALAVDRKTGALTHLNTRATGGAAPCHVSVDAGGQMVMVANYVGGSVASFRQADGALSQRVSLHRHTGRGPNAARQEQAHAHSITPGPDNRYAYAPDLGADRIVGYTLVADEGRLVPTPDLTTATEPGDGPRHLALHPDGRRLYVINELANAIAGFAIDPTDGTLQSINRVPTLPTASVGESITADIHVHPGGSLVYGSNRGHNSLVICRLQADGALDVVGHQTCGGDHPRSFMISADGNWLLVANQNSSNIVTHRIDTATGALAAVHEFSLPAPVCLCPAGW